MSNTPRENRENSFLKNGNEKRADSNLGGIAKKFVIALAFVCGINLVGKELSKNHSFTNALDAIDNASKLLDPASESEILHHDKFPEKELLLPEDLIEKKKGGQGDKGVELIAENP